MPISVEVVPADHRCPHRGVAVLRVENSFRWQTRAAPLVAVAPHIGHAHLLRDAVDGSVGE
ncbi:MAG: hypothetical protein ACYCX9_11580 [Candidatus Dormibacteria bacterium]|jgi:hypothetical protein